MSGPTVGRFFVGALGLAVLAVGVALLAPREWVELRREALEAEQRFLEERLDALQREEGAAFEALAAARAEEEAKVAARLEVGELDAEIREARTRLEQNRYLHRRLAASRSRPATSSVGALPEPGSELERLQREAEGLRTMLDEAEERRARAVEDLEKSRRAERAGTQRLRMLEERLAVSRARSAHSVVELRPPGLAERIGDGSWRPRVDRCGTCHVAALRADEVWDEGAWPSPHPRRDLFVADDSPHPAADFGCTVCHGGAGRSLDLAGSGHGVPGGILRSGTLACRECHGESREADGRVEDLLVREGCDGCHRLPGQARSGGLPAMGPPIGTLGERRSLRESLLELGPGGGHRPTWSGLEDVELAALFSVLDEQRPARVGKGASSRKGDAERGEALFTRIGCRACHPSLAGEDGDGTLDAPAARGPSVAAMRRGSADAWARLLEDPSEWASRGMPDFRLSETEVRDVVAFLRPPEESAPEQGTSESNEDDPSRPAFGGFEVDLQRLDERLGQQLSDELALEEIAAVLRSEETSEKLVRLGRDLLVRRGCLGCHGEGEEKRAPIGSPLGTRGVESVDAWHPSLGVGLDLGLAEVEIREIADHLGWKHQDGIPRDRRVLGESERDDVRQGRRLAIRLGCDACHALDRGDPKGIARSTLAGIGAQRRPEWLVRWLGDPSASPLTRPGGARMPTYALDEDQIALLVRWMVSRTGASLLAEGVPTSTREERALGKEVYSVLQCARCHGDGVAADERAPGYADLAERTRPDWLIEWLLHPQQFDPDTRMPSLLHGPAAEGGDTSYLAAALGTPIFRPERARLLRWVEDEEELESWVSDPRRIARALRAHLLAGVEDESGS